MTRKTITIIAALSSVALLTAGYFGAQAWIKAHPKTPLRNPSSVLDVPKLTNFDSNKLKEIENVGQGFTLEKRGETWEVITTAGVPADKIRIDQRTFSYKLWSISNAWTEGIVEEEPADLSIFGLDNPLNHIIISDSEGNRAELLFGNMNPSHSSYYVMKAGEPTVYTMSSYSADNLLFDLDSIRDKNLLNDIDLRSLTRFILEPRPEENAAGKGRIDITPRDPDNYLISSFCSYFLNAPYKITYGADSEKYGNLMEAIQGLQINEFVDDNPASLAPYGLDKPGRIHLESPEQTIEILFGKNDNGLRYAMIPGDSSVFSLTGFEPIAAANAFNLMDKFALILDIKNVDSITIAEGGRTLEAQVQDDGDNAVFHLNGRKTADKEFRNFYQAIIGLLIDAEYSGAPVQTPGPEMVIEYRLNTPPGVRASIRLIPYNRDFYILEKEGVREFLISRTQVRHIFETADDMVYED